MLVYEAWKQTIKLINSEVNALPYVSDPVRYDKPDVWVSIVDAKSGDCEDYAIGKINRLAKLGAPIEDLLIALCWVEGASGPGTGEYHAVAVITTDQGDLVLDNRQAEPVWLRDLQSKYRFHKMLKPDRSGWQYVSNSP